jgi:ATP-binding cassette, subfamily B, bacterial
VKKDYNKQMPKNTKPSVDRETIKIFWRTGLLSRRWFILSWLFPIGAIFFSVVTPYFIGKTLAALVRPGVDPKHYIVLFVVSAIVGLTANRIGFVRLLSWQAKTMSHLQSFALEALLKRGVSFHNNNVGGKLVSDAIDYPTAFSQLSNAFFVNLVPLGVILLSGTLVIFIESWLLGVVTVLMILFTVVTGATEQHRRLPLRLHRLKASKKMIAHLADTVTNVHTVKTFAREHDELKRNDDLNIVLRDLRLKDWASAARLGNTRIAVLLLFQLIIVMLTIHLVHQQPQLLGAGIFAFSFTITLSNRLFEVNTMLRTIEDSLMQAEPMTQIMLDEAEIKDAPEAKRLEVAKGAISFSDVHFRYRDGNTDQAVFDGLDLDIKAGEKIGLVGPSGGGKSTFTRLLLRFEDIEGGEISIDGQNIAAVTQASLRQHISYVPQEPLMFHRSVRENVAYGNPDATDKQVIAAAKAAHAEGFIAGLPKGYDTIVGERGVKLSGGQRQRIAIARAILKDAPILVLDEATSALDSESEVLIQDALWKLMEGRTAIVIAHRLSTIQKMDRIIVLDEGRIAEQGKHADLLKQKGLYAKLWAHQSGGFIED